MSNYLICNYLTVECRLKICIVKVIYKKNLINHCADVFLSELCYVYIRIQLVFVEKINYYFLHLTSKYTSQRYGKN